MEFFLRSTNDKTDRSAEIENLLNQYKTCVLCPGTYYVSGVKMPDDTSLFGMGEGSRILLNEDVTEGYAVSVGSRCTLKDLTFIGGDEDMPRPTEVGNRHGIGFVGNATTTERGVQPRDSIVEGCRIRNFSGKCCRHCGFRRYQIYLSVCGSGPAFEIPVEGPQGYTAGIRCEAHSNAWSAGTFQNPGTTGQNIRKCTTVCQLGQNLPGPW